MQAFVQTIVTHIAWIAEAAAAAVILTGMIQALWIYFSRNLRSRCSALEMPRGRLKLGHALSLALELLIGADILKSAVSPTWEDLGQLAAIVAIRTILNYFLLYEMRTLQNGEGQDED